MYSWTYLVLADMLPLKLAQLSHHPFYAESEFFHFMNHHRSYGHYML